jgi:hypothetical protein
LPLARGDAKLEQWALESVPGKSEGAETRELKLKIVPSLANCSGAAILGGLKSDQDSSNIFGSLSYNYIYFDNAGLNLSIRHSKTPVVVILPMPMPCIKVQKKQSLRQIGQICTVLCSWA